MEYGLVPNPLQPLSLGVPAFLGLNTEVQTSVIGPEWATVLNNIVFDSSGRIAARKGWEISSTIAGGGKVQALMNYSTGSIIAATVNKLYLDGVDITGTIVTPTKDYWKFVQFNSKVIGFQTAHDPIVYAGTSFAPLGAIHGGSMPTTWGGAALAAYGRIWAIDSSKQIIKYSALLDETDFDASGVLTDATAGFIDLKSVWKNGFDEVQAIESHNGNLVIFGKKSILIYATPTLPFSAMALVEDITGIGCIARDSAAVVGEDIWFLSASGVRSLGRTILKDKMPLQDYSKNIRTYLINHTLTVGTKDSIKATYNEKEGFYLLAVPESNRSFIFDVRRPLEDGSVRVSTWTGTVPTALLSANNDILYMGEDGFVGKYATYLDNATNYSMEYHSGWLTMEEEGTGTRYVIPKQLKALVYVGYNTTFTFGWKFDFASTGFTATKSITGTASDEYNITEYNIGEYSGGGTLKQLKMPMKGYGNLFRIEVDVVVPGFEVAIQKIDIYAKLGRTN